MKRFFVTLCAVALLGACAEKPVVIPAPMGTVERVGEDVAVSAGGDVIEYKVSGNCAWAITDTYDDVALTVTPLSGAANKETTVTVVVNPSESLYEVEHELVFVFTNSKEESLEKKVKIKVDKIEGEVICEGPFELPLEGGIVNFNPKVSCAWEMTCPDYVQTNVTSGSGGNHGQFFVTLGRNYDVFPKTHEFVFTLQDPSFAVTEYKFTITQAPSTSVTYGDVEYPVKIMKDGKAWFAENLRYLPAGKVASDKTDSLSILNGIWYPLDTDGTNPFFSKESAVIAKKGYLYNIFGWLNISDGQIPSGTAIQNLDKVQGICPDGWRLPVMEDIMGLVGECADQTTNADAPYYDASRGDAYMTLLNEDGFNIEAIGYVRLANIFATSVTMVGLTGTAPNKAFNMSYIASTAARGFTGSGSTQNFQYYGIMTMRSKDTCNGAKFGIGDGVSVRCVRENPDTLAAE